MALVYSKNPSKNKKIAAINADGNPAWPFVYATYRTVGETCPMRCGFHPAHEGESRVEGKVCYALKGRTVLHSKRGTRDESDGDVMYRWVQGLPPGSAVRVHVSGDVFMPSSE